MDFSSSSNLQNFQSPLAVNLSSSLAQPHELQDPLFALSSTASQASATDITTASSFAFGQRSETWRQGRGGLRGEAENGLLASNGFGTSVYQRGDEFGQTVATGDFDGDGYVDLAIGSPGENSEPYSDDSGDRYDEYRYNGPGRVDIILGSATGLSNITQTFEVDGAIAFGRSLATGDFNSDGKMDLAVGSRSGSIYILNGRSYGLQQPSVSLSSGSHALATGDFNGDGTTDLAAGNPFTNNEEGSVTIFHGTANVGLTGASQTWSQDSPGISGAAEGVTDPHFNSSGKWGDRFGFSLAAGDFNGDGSDDLAIGAPGEMLDGRPRAGAVNVLYGSGSGLTAMNDQFWDQNGTESTESFDFNLQGGIEENDQFGYALAAGDFNRDGIADLAIGVPGEDDDGGAVAIIYGKGYDDSVRRYIGLTNKGNELIDQDTSGMEGVQEDEDRFGESLTVGDFDNNGAADLVVGIPNEDSEDGERGGAVSIILGEPGGFARRLNLLFDQRHVTGAKLEDADLFGQALAAGDFNGDGSDDLAIGAPGEKAGSGVFNHAGEVNVLYGQKYFPTVSLSSQHSFVHEGSSSSTLISFPTISKHTPLTLKSVGTAKLGVDFTVSAPNSNSGSYTPTQVTVNGDFVTLQLRPFRGEATHPGTFQVSAIADLVEEGNENIEFVVVKGDGYTVDPAHKLSLRIKDGAPLVVDSLVDENDGDYSAGDVSLREAILEMMGSSSTVSFAPELQGTITLNSQLLIDKNLTINGTGADRISISGNNTSRVFEIAKGATVNLEGLTIRDGSANNDIGGGIKNYGTLTVSNSRLTNNQASSGGGIYNQGNLTLNNSTVDNNTASWAGGGLYGLGRVSISNSTFSGNTAGEGGAINHSTANLMIDHSTITNNTATLEGSGGIHGNGIVAQGFTTIGNSIVAGNHAPSNSIGDIEGYFNSLGYNLIGNTAGAFGSLTTGDLSGSRNNPLNPQLGSLQNNGGTTPTHALLTGSLAIDAGNPNNPSADQRGVAVQNGRRDIGAFEFVAPVRLMDNGLPVEDLPIEFIDLPFAVNEFDCLIDFDSID